VNWQIVNWQIVNWQIVNWQIVTWQIVNWQSGICYIALVDEFLMEHPFHEAK